MSTKHSLGRVTLTVSILVRVLIALCVLGVAFVLLLMLGFAGDSPAAPDKTLNHWLSSTFLFAFSGVALTIVPLSLFTASSYVLRAIPYALLAVFVYSIITLAKVLL